MYFSYFQIEAHEKKFELNCHLELHFDNCPQKHVQYTTVQNYRIQRALSENWFNNQKIPLISRL